MASKSAPVEEGDTVTTFVRRYQITVSELRELNGALDVDADGVILTNTLLVPTAAASDGSSEKTTTSTGVVVEKKEDVATIGDVKVAIETIPIGGGHKLCVAAANQFLLMVEAAKTDGIDLPVLSSFRSSEKQKELYARFLAGTGNRAAPPGKSTHEQGRSVDIVECPFESDRYKWLKLNAARFGFRADALGPPQPEPWHWTFYG